MLVKSLTYEQRKKNTIFVRYFLVAKPEKKLSKEIHVQLFFFGRMKFIQ